MLHIHQHGELIQKGVFRINNRGLVNNMSKNIIILKFSKYSLSKYIFVSSYGDEFDTSL